MSFLDTHFPASRGGGGDTPQGGWGGGGGTHEAPEKLGTAGLVV